MYQYVDVLACVASVINNHRKNRNETAFWFCLFILIWFPLATSHWFPVYFLVCTHMSNASVGDILLSSHHVALNHDSLILQRRHQNQKHLPTSPLFVGCNWFRRLTHSRVSYRCVRNMSDNVIPWVFWVRCPDKSDSTIKHLTWGTADTHEHTLH